MHRTLRLPFAVLACLALAPWTSAQATQDTATQKPATIRVYVPANAQIVFDGYKTKACRFQFLCRSGDWAATQENEFGDAAAESDGRRVIVFD